MSRFPTIFRLRKPLVLTGGKGTAPRPSVIVVGSEGGRDGGAGFVWRAETRLAPKRPPSLTLSLGDREGRDTSGTVSLLRPPRAILGPLAVILGVSEEARTEERHGPNLLTPRRTGGVGFGGLVRVVRPVDDLSGVGSTWLTSAHAPGLNPISGPGGRVSYATIYVPGASRTNLYAPGAARTEIFLQ